MENLTPYCTGRLESTRVTIRVIMMSHTPCRELYYATLLHVRFTRLLHCIIINIAIAVFSGREQRQEFFIGLVGIKSFGPPIRQ
jgi:hypothetical protein